MTSILRRLPDTAVAIDSDGKTVVSLDAPLAGRVVPPDGEAQPRQPVRRGCALLDQPERRRCVDSIDIRLGSDFDTSNYLVLPHAYAGGSAAPTLECSSDVSGTFTVKSAKLVAIESQTLSIMP